MKKLLIVCLLPLVACQKETNDDKKKDPALIPLAVGNYWIYNGKYFEEDGSV